MVSGPDIADQRKQWDSALSAGSWLRQAGLDTQHNENCRLTATCQSMWVIHVTKVFRATQVFLGTHVFLEQYRGLQTKVLLLGPGDRGARRSSRLTYCGRDQGTPREQITVHPAPSGPTYSATRRLFPFCSIGPRSGSLVTSGRVARSVARATIAVAV